MRRQHSGERTRLACCFRRLAENFPAPFGLTIRNYSDADSKNRRRGAERSTRGACAPQSFLPATQPGIGCVFFCGQHGGALADPWRQFGTLHRGRERAHKLVTKALR
jgi:hypothetical protein